MLIVMAMLAIMLVIILGIMVYGFDLVNTSFNSIDFTIGNTSFNESYQQTLSQGVSAMRITVPRTVGLGVLFGMIIVMFLIGYFAPKIDPLWILLDIFVLIFCEIIVFIGSQSLSNLINSSPKFLEIYGSGSLYEAATFVLNLPVYLPIIGVLVMVATYIMNKNQNKKELNF